ncbi:unnamed protein product [Ceratitis capitata]|uniref:(Mediterranean fruit fly) hypothetical protein n=1 Tax=Ceratitis capitata TaxID=7213 RepID=A0A811ULB4_CERCA|nr:unnamed protein product [Ceratitis capitata]
MNAGVITRPHFESININLKEASATRGEQVDSLVLNAENKDKNKINQTNNNNCRRNQCNLEVKTQEKNIKNKSCQKLIINVSKNKAK